MFEKSYSPIDDLELIRNEFSNNDTELANNLKITRSALMRWLNGTIQIPFSKYEDIYSLLYHYYSDFNDFKAFYFTKKYTKGNCVTLFHGSKEGIKGNLSLTYSDKNNDFGRGIYFGDNLIQSMLFVSSYPNSKIYSFVFDTTNLKVKKYKIDTEWMLTIAYYRGKLTKYENSKKLKELIGDINDVDYIFAPIADNRMFMIIDRFINEEISDEQCSHCLSSLNLGSQYILKSEKAIKQTKLIHEYYYSIPERKDKTISKFKYYSHNDEKIKDALKQYAGKGKYLSEILDD